jgi:aspartyl-tRNA(Asn)/glutamyl-tRNA(Gln) amidotransferase subunit C
MTNVECRSFDIRHSTFVIRHSSFITPMSLSRQEVERVSLLARLRLSETELDTMTAQLGQVVQYVDQLSELDTQDVEPMAHAVEVSNVFRGDELRPSLDRAEALANAPHHDGQFYLVPAVLG